MLLTHKLLGVIFDLDNTLVSSSLNFDCIRESLGCAKEIDLLDFVDSLPENKKIAANKVLVDYEISDALSASKLAGTDELLALLSKLSIPCAIVTRNCKQAALIKLNNNNIDVPILLTREDHKAKPAPDALLHLAQYWNTPPENLLYVGDYLYDLQAAQNANTMSCLVTYAKALSYASLANIVVNDLSELSEAIKQKFSVNNVNVCG
ncbi:HAD family hydrolase [Colwellia demingiae]|uniref:HAD family hydrolase n=1 Tax=Colwellia demingiae TaxID=89401 RepID=A0A5C6Q779_9GAMM|nr:HAD family hydrolase [Colwellia demingiae]